MDAHFGKASDLLAQFGTDELTGLSADRAVELQVKYGPNRLKEQPPKTFLQRFLAQMKDAMVIILLIAAAVSLGLSFYNTAQGAAGDWAEPIAIILIVLLNGILGVVQESKAEAALEALKRMSAPSATALRDGEAVRIATSSLVPGDIVLLEAGDMIPADGRILECSSLKCDEASLTGESVPAEKYDGDDVELKAPLGDRHNMVYTGCSVSNGRARVLVCDTGMNTEMGKVAAMLEGEKDGDTPLQQKLAQLGKQLGFLALGICAVIFVIGLIDDLPLMEMFMTAVSLAVAAIPEGLPAIVTIVLAIGVQRMVKKNAIIRRLPAVETLGSASVICSDKTGTLTLNRMTLVNVATPDGIENVADGLFDKATEVLRLAALCCDGSVSERDGKLVHIGDPTETAIVAAAYVKGMTAEKLNAESPRLFEIPFDSDRKLMTSVNVVDGRKTVIVKGAPDILMARCSGGDIKTGLEQNALLARDAIRVLGVAYKFVDETPNDKSDVAEVESGLTFAGLVGMIDPPREEVKLSIAECRKAGIIPVMITGDHVITAAAIAKQLGMLDDDSQAISGSELAEMSDKQLLDKVTHYRVYARVTPTDKIRIVKAWQQKGKVVAMTGDGVNDAPALKAADIGCAMGITGTDVAKGAADMTLTDDNFSTIVSAVKEGRGIYDNIRKAVRFLLSCNLGEILTVFASMILWRESPLMPIQLLWINLVTDSMPALALGVEPVEYDVMDRKPRQKDEGLFSNGVGTASVLQGLLVGILTLIAYYIGSRVYTLAGGGVNIPLGETMAFATLAVAQLVHAINVRSSHSIFKVGLTSNKYMIGAFFASLSLMLVVLLVPPLRAIFEVTAMTAAQWGIVGGLSLSMFVIMEIVKLIKKLSGKTAE